MSDAPLQRILLLTHYVMVSLLNVRLFATFIPSKVFEYLAAAKPVLR